MSNIETIFTFIDQQAEKTDQLYLESVVEVCQRWFAGEQIPPLSGDVTKEEIRRGIQLAVLKGMRKAAQPHHQMTPDAVSMIVGYLINGLTKHQEVVTLLDPAVGTGNLLLTVMNQLNQRSSAYAVEIDDLLVRLAAVSANLLAQPVQFFIQDGLRPLLVEPVDIVTCDLPVGFYPDDDHALNFQTMPTEGHAYAHHLFIEQSMTYLKSGGFGVFIAPANLFESEQTQFLHQYIKKSGIYVRAVIQFPETLFQTNRHAKCLVIFQQRKDGQTVTSDVLLASVPDMRNKKATMLFFQQIDGWIEEQRGIE